MRRHLRPVTGRRGLCEAEIRALALEEQRCARRDHVVGMIGAVMVVTFVIGSWSLLVTLISALIAAGRAMAIAGLVSVGCALVVAVLYELLKRMVERGIRVDVAPVDSVDAEVPEHWTREASQG